MRIPRMLLNAIQDGSWRIPESFSLDAIWGRKCPPGLADLELFPDLDTMREVYAQLSAAGYVVDPEFCMVKMVSDLDSEKDARLVYDTAVFIAGSKVPGDDVFLAIDQSKPSNEPSLRIFDWGKPVPNRWVGIGPLSSFLDRLIAVQH